MSLDTAHCPLRGKSTPVENHCTEQHVCVSQFQTDHERTSDICEYQELFPIGKPHSLTSHPCQQLLSHRLNCLIRFSYSQQQNCWLNRHFSFQSVMLYCLTNTHENTHDWMIRMNVSMFLRRCRRSQKEEEKRRIFSSLLHIGFFILCYI